MRKKKSVPHNLSKYIDIVKKKRKKKKKKNSKASYTTIKIQKTEIKSKLSSFL